MAAGPEEGSGAMNPGKPLIEWVQEDIQQRIESVGPSPQIHCQGELICESSVLGRFYGQRFFRPAWISERGDLPQADLFLQAIHEADREGLRAVSAPRPHHAR